MLSIAVACVTSVALHPCPSAMLISRAVIPSWAMITDIALLTVNMLD